MRQNSSKKNVAELKGKVRASAFKDIVILGGWLDSKKVLSFFSIVIMGFSIIVAAAVCYHEFVYKKRNATGLGTSADFYPTPDNVEVETISPWDHSDDELSEYPGLPEVDELDKQYKQMRESIRTRDYDLFKSIASSERIWHFENNKILLGESEDGLDIFDIIEQEGGSNFRENAPCALLFMAEAPSVNGIAAGEVKKIALEGNRRYIVSRADSSQIVIPTYWRYALSLTYSFSESAGVTGSGTATFVFDKDAWKYHGEFWEVTCEEGSVFGDKSDDANEVHTVGHSEQTNKFFGSIRIKAGDAIVWQNINGLLYTYGADGRDWESMYLRGGDFTKVFDQKGEYHYSNCNLEHNLEGIIFVE